MNTEIYDLYQKADEEFIKFQDIILKGELDKDGHPIHAQGEDSSGPLQEWKMKIGGQVHTGTEVETE